MRFPSVVCSSSAGSDFASPVETGSDLSVAVGARSGDHFKSPPDIGLVEMVTAPRSSVEIARTGGKCAHEIAFSSANPQRLRAGVGIHFHQADIGRRLKMNADARPQHELPKTRVQHALCELRLHNTRGCA